MYIATITLTTYKNDRYVAIDWNNADSKRDHRAPKYVVQSECCNVGFIVYRSVSFFVKAAYFRCFNTSA